jgi:hypothetical protein
MTAKREQNRQPITMLPVIAHVVAGMLDGAAERPRTSWPTTTPRPEVRRRLEPDAEGSRQSRAMGRRNRRL